MPVLLSLVRPAPTNIYVPAIPGTQFFFFFFSTTAAMTDFAETILISLHLLQQYHSDHHLMRPIEMALCLHKKAGECMQEQNRESQMVSGILDFWLLSFDFFVRTHVLLP